MLSARILGTYARAGIPPPGRLFSSRGEPEGHKPARVCGWPRRAQSLDHIIFMHEASHSVVTNLYSGCTMHKNETIQLNCHKRVSVF